MGKGVADTDEARRDEVLRRMLTTPKKPLYESAKKASIKKEGDELATRRPPNAIKSG